MSQSWNPDDRIANGVSQIQTISHRSSPEELLIEMQRRSTLKNQRRMRLTFSLSAACVASLGVAALLLPGKAEASFDKVIRNSKGQKVFYRKEYSMIKSDKWASEATTELWQFANRSVSRTSQRQATMALDPSDRIEQHPFYSETLWINDDATTLCYNPDFHAAMKYDEGHQVAFDLSETLAQMAQEGKVVGPQKEVRAHGGAFDEYRMNMARGSVSIEKTIYVDPKTQLVRFIDMTSHSREDDMIQSTEMRYPDATQLAQEEPKLPAGYPVVKPDEVKKRFEREIKEPVETKVIGGMDITLYGVVIRSPGDIRAITTGGAPRDYQDTTHEMLVLDHPTRLYRNKPWPVGTLMQVPDPTYPADNRKILSTYGIGKRRYVVESSRRAIVGEIPRQITIRVPVWKYDYSHPLDGMGRKVYPSLFVGYVTFKTDKIYEMPGGIANGAAAAQLPNRYGPADPANQVAVASEK